VKRAAKPEPDSQALPEIACLGRQTPRHERGSLMHAANATQTTSTSARPRPAASASARSVRPNAQPAAPSPIAAVARPRSYPQVAAAYARNASAQFAGAPHPAQPPTTTSNKGTRAFNEKGRGNISNACRVHLRASALLLAVRGESGELHGNIPPPCLG